ncbi:MAG: T9SS type A sorting domain-containing protein [Ignavibacteriae bacterium]|nr:T9SS type A sorting domain-containing protein [Ignavibacteria bacterium]MBI3364080.1 T9SS type A sorting domain-containing protein [Ignavibacteriota bacterium]
MQFFYRTLSYFIVLIAGLMLMSTIQATGQVWRKRTVAAGENVGINPLNPNTIYTERTIGTLSVSRDRGLTWTALPTSPPLNQIRHIFVHPNDTLTIFAVDFFNGLWRTTNEGASWAQVLSSYGIDGESMDFDHQHPDTMFAGNFSNGNVFRSLDRGATWTLRGSTSSNLCALTVNPSDADIILTGSGASTISKSTDGGQTWFQVHNGGTSEVPKIVYNPNDTSIAYATTYGPTDAVCDLWKTTDGGNTWFKTALQQRANWSLAMDVQHPETLYVGWFTSSAGAAISRTTDGGVSFQDINTGLPPNFSAWNLRVHPLDPTAIFVAGTQNAFGADGVYQLMLTSNTHLTGSILETGTNTPIVANVIKVLSTGDSLINTGSYTFDYYPGDPTLTPTVHVTATNHQAKDTVVTFVNGTTQNADIHLDPLPPNSINGTVYEDLNGNGARDPGEPGVANWTVVILPGGGTTLTDANGNYSFSGLTTGNYDISEQLQSGWYPTFPFCPDNYFVPFTQGTDVVGKDFGVEQILPGAIFLQESFTETQFPPPCWSITDANGGLTWFRGTTNNHTDPGSARNGNGSSIGEGKHDDWLFTHVIHLKAGSQYRLSWWDRTFIFTGQTGLDSLAAGIATGQTPGAVINIINSRGFNTNLAQENVQQDFSVSSDGDYYIGFHDFSASGNTLRVDDVILSYVQPLVSGSISGRKFNDVNNNGADDAEAGVPNWKIRLSGAAVESVLTDANGNYSFTFLPVGSYTVSEASVAGWVQTFPPGGTYNVTITGGDDHTGQDFGNFHPNTIIVRKFEDADGDFNTTGDRTLKAWYLDVASFSSGSSGTLTVPGLVDGKYFAEEADSAGWIHLGYILNGVPVSSTANSVSVIVANGQTATVDFINAPPIYSRLFRTGRMIDWALDEDKGHRFKPVKAKPDSVHFKINLVAVTDTLFVKFSQVAAGRVFIGKDKLVQGSQFIGSNSAYLYFGHGGNNPDINPGDTIQIDGTGFKGRAISVDYSWLSPVAGRAKVIAKGKLAPGKVPLTPGDTIKLNQLLLPMPNLHNVGTELFTFKNAFSAEGGLLIGEVIPESIKTLAWVLHKKYSDVQASLNKKGVTHTVTVAGWFNTYLNGRPIKGQLKNLPPDKANNQGFAEAVALGMNLAASDFGQMPAGLGDLVIGYGGVPGCDSIEGMTVREFYNNLRKWFTNKGRIWRGMPITSPCRDNLLVKLFQVAEDINNAFSGPDDTTSWSGVKVIMPGVRPLIEVPFLHANPNGPAAVPLVAERIPGSGIPEQYELRQNYPNPFNPMTTIEFALPEVSLVTLRVYNILGQEVATLLDHQMLDDGEQQVDFDASSLSSGVYFYRLTTESVVTDPEAGDVSGRAFTSTRKMLLLK